MKLTGRDAAAYLNRPDPSHAGMLLFGPDPLRVADKRKALIEMLVGPDGESEMRLTRITAADLRKDGAMLNDALRSQGFFPGHRVVFVEDAADSVSKPVGDALSDWSAGDAQLVVTANQLTPKSALRKLFEGHRSAVSIGIYDDPPTRSDIEASIAASGLADPPRDAVDALVALAQTIEPGDFRQTLEKLSLYKQGDSAPLSQADIATCAPTSADVDIDDILDVVSNGMVADLGPSLRTIYAQGVLPTTLCIGAMRHFKRLYQIASDPGGAGAGIAKLRPPVFGPRRDKYMRQASNWGRDRLERALSALTDTDLQMRSTSLAPQHALMERTLVRLSMLAKR